MILKIVFWCLEHQNCCYKHQNCCLVPYEIDPCKKKQVIISPLSEQKDYCNLQKFGLESRKTFARIC